MLDKSADFIFFLLETDIENGYLTLPLRTEQISETSAEVVGPGPAPSPCRTDLPTGFPSIITAFKTPLTLLNLESLLIKHGWTL